MWIKGDSQTEQRYFDYLERLRQSGSTNMFGAGPYLQREFVLSHAESLAVLGKWMNFHKDPARELPGPGTPSTKLRPPIAVNICQGGFCHNAELDPGEEICDTCEKARER